MGLLTLRSENPNFSHVVSKNPATVRDKNEPFKWSLRRGQIYGWFPDDKGQEFRLWFKDTPTESSFATGANEEFEYLDCTRYGSPYLPIGLIATALSTCSKTRHELDVDSKTTLETAIKVPNSIVRFDSLAEHFCGQGVSLEYDLISSKYLKIILTGTSVFQVLNVIQILAIMCCFEDPDTYVRMDQTVMEKFIKVFNRAEAPYYPRYIFQTKSMSDRGTFKKLKGDLECEGMTLNYGDTRMQRFDAISPILPGGKLLIDIGCGEMFYSLRKSGSYETVIAIDADEERCENNRGKVEGRKIDNVQVVCEPVTAAYVLENKDLFDGADILLTEVIEHMEKQDGLDLVQALLTTNFRNIIVTVPNQDFNKYYLMEDGQFRHPDHKWEPTFEEFCDDMASFETSLETCVTTQGIGDCVNDSNVTCMTVFSAYLPSNHPLKGV